MFLKLSKFRLDLVMLTIAVCGGLMQAGTATAASQVYPSNGCEIRDQRDDSNVLYGQSYSCSISVPAATKALKVLVYYVWIYKPASNSSGRPFDSQVSCNLWANDALGLTISGSAARITLPVIRPQANVVSAQLIVPSLPSLNGGYALVCTMPINTASRFSSSMTAFKAVTQ